VVGPLFITFTVPRISSRGLMSKVNFEVAVTPSVKFSAGN